MNLFPTSKLASEPVLGHPSQPVLGLLFLWEEIAPQTGLIVLELMGVDFKTGCRLSNKIMVLGPALA